jgi:nitroreductase
MESLDDGDAVVRQLGLSAREVLTTTRAVRRRLDLERVVDRADLVECTRIAQQAPSGRNRQRWDFLFVTDAVRRAELARLWRLGLTHPVGLNHDSAPSREDFSGPGWQAIANSLTHLVDNLERVPVLLVPCVRVGSRAELSDPVIQAGTWGSVLPAVWSFMLAAREHGLGSVWTTPHLHYEREAAEILGVPFDSVVQCALIPLAHTVGTDFKPGRRVDAEDVVHWDSW